MRRHRSSTLRGLGLATPLAKTKPVDGPLYLGYHDGALKGHVWGVQSPRSSLPCGREGCWLHSGIQA